MRISIIVLTVLRNIQRFVDAGNDAEANSRRMNQIRQTYIDLDLLRESGRQGEEL
jgi:hypothetical protein